jgi:hypothetical protein
MPGRSYAQLRWQYDQLGLLMVNGSNERFSIHADKLLELFDRQDEYLVVKLRDRRPTRATGHYGGQILGTMDLDDGSYRLSLYISEPHKDVVFDHDAGRPKSWMIVHKYVFPREELERFRDVISTMLSQKREFDRALRSSEATPLVTRGRATESD